jgi:hypothetical protein
MFQNMMIDIAIGLVLMYLTLSLVCTVINELIATKLELRSGSLAAGLQGLLDDPTVRAAFYNSTLIAGTAKVVGTAQHTIWHAIKDQFRPAPAAAAAPAPVTAAPAALPAVDAKHPSYVSAETFVLALIGALTPGRQAAGQPAPTFADVQAAVEALPPSGLKSALLGSLTMAEHQLAAFRAQVATWFDDSMDRLSGAYKRQLKVISLVIGCAVAVIVNADTFTVSYALWSSSVLREQVVEVAGKVVEKGLGPTPDKPTAKDVSNGFKQATDALSPLLPVGWHYGADGKLAGLPDTFWGWFAKFIGWFVTGLALSLGAPFWFDLLSKFVNIRGAGTKPKRADEKRA